MNNPTKTLILSATLMLSASVVTAQEVESTEVDITTPDNVLLEGKDKAAMYQVAEPSSALTVTVEGIKNPIEIVSVGDDPAAVVKDGSDEELQTASEIVGKVIGEEAAEIEVSIEKTSTDKKSK